MKKSKKILIQGIKVVSYPILFAVGTVLLTFIFSFCFQEVQYQKIVASNSTLSSEQIQEKHDQYLASQDFHQDLTVFLDKQTLPILGITVFLFLPFFYFIYQKGRVLKPEKITIRHTISLCLLGICCALFFNLFILLLTKEKIIFPENIWVALLGSGIFGPILEEFLFRGIVYQKWQKFLTKNASLLFTSLLFALFHSTIDAMIYAFFFSIILCLIFDRFHSIKAPILVHVLGNCSVVLLIPLLSRLPSFWFWFLMLFFLVIGYLIIKKLKLSPLENKFEKKVHDSNVTSL